MQDDWSSEHGTGSRWEVPEVKKSTTPPAAPFDVGKFLGQQPVASGVLADPYTEETIESDEIVLPSGTTLRKADYDFDEFIRRQVVPAIDRAEQEADTRYDRTLTERYAPKDRSWTETIKAAIRSTPLPGAASTAELIRNAGEVRRERGPARIFKEVMEGIDPERVADFIAGRLKDDPEYAAALEETTAGMDADASLPFAEDQLQQFVSAMSASQKKQYDKAIDAEEKRIGEAQRKLQKAASGAWERLSANFQQRIGEALVDEMARRNMPRNELEAFARTVYETSIPGLLTEWAVGNVAGDKDEKALHAQIMQRAIEKFDPALLTRIGGEVAGLLLGAPVFGAGGALGKAGAAGVRKLAERSVLRKLAGKGITAGAESIARRTVARSLPAQLAQAAVTSGTTLGTYDALSEPLQRLAAGQNPELKDVLGAAARGFATGTLLPGIGMAAGRAADAASTRLGRYAAELGGFAAENAAFVGMGTLYRGLRTGEWGSPEQLAEEFGHSVGVLGILKGIGALKRGRVKNRGFYDKVLSETEFTPEEVEALSRIGVDGRSYKRAIFDLLKAGETSAGREVARKAAKQVESRYAEVMQSPEVPVSAKAKLMFLVEGRVPFTLPLTTDIRRSVKEDGRTTVDLLDPAGNLVQRRTFTSEKAADAFERENAGLREINTIQYYEALIGRLQALDTAAQDYAVERDMPVEIVKTQLRNAAEGRPYDRMVVREVVDRVRPEEAGMDIPGMIAEEIGMKYGLGEEGMVRALTLKETVRTPEQRSAVREYASRLKEFASQELRPEAATPEMRAERQLMQVADQAISGTKNRDDDVIYTATMHDGRTVNIIKGSNLVFDPQTGEVDAGQSDPTVVVRYEDGTMRQVGIGELDMIVEAVDAADAQAEAWRTIREQLDTATREEALADAVENGGMVELADGRVGFVEGMSEDGRLHVALQGTDGRIGTEDVSFGEVVGVIREEPNGASGIADEESVGVEHAETEELLAQQEAMPTGGPQEPGIETSLPGRSDQPVREIPRLKDGTPDYNGMTEQMLADELTAAIGHDRAVERLQVARTANGKKIAKLQKDLSEMADLNKAMAAEQRLLALQREDARLAGALELLGAVEAPIVREPAAGTFTQEIERLFPYGLPNVRAQILADIARGQRFVWNDSPDGSKRGVASEIGFTGNESERRARFGILGSEGNGAKHVSSYVHDLWQNSNGYAFDMDDAAMRDEVVDVLLTTPSRAAAMEQLRNQAEPFEEALRDAEDAAAQQAHAEEQNALRRNEKSSIFAEGEIQPGMYGTEEEVGGNNGGGLSAATDTGGRVVDDPAAEIPGVGDRGDIRVFEEGLASSYGQHPEHSERDRREAESERLVAVAKENGLFIDPQRWNNLGVKYPKRTGESVVLIDAPNGKVYKVKDPYAKAAIKGGQPEDAIYEHIVHNLFFPETRYKFEGISEHLGDARIVLSQDYIDSYGQPTQQQIDAALAARGLFSEDRYNYGNDLVSVTDVEGDNVLLGNDGRLYFIDPIIRLKKPAREVIAALEERRMPLSGDDTSTQRGDDWLDSDVPFSIVGDAAAAPAGITPERWNIIVDQLRRAVGPDRVVTDPDEVRAAYELVSSGGRFFRTHAGEVYGFTVGGKIYLDGQRMNAEAPLHEYTELWAQIVAKENPQLWSKGVELMKRTDVWAEVNSDPNYRALSEELRASETLSRIVAADFAREQATITSDAKLLGKIRSWLRKFWGQIKKTFSKWTKRDLETLSADKFAKMPLKDFVEGIDLRKYLDEKTLAGVHNISVEKFKKVLKQGGLANPSAAVIDVERQRHDNYGEISLILPSSLIDKTTGRNAGTFQNDAWTPTYPVVERRVGHHSSKRFTNDLVSLPEAMQNDIRMGMNDWLNGRGSQKLAYMFLYEKGEAPALRITPERYSAATREAVDAATRGSFSLDGTDRNAREVVLDSYIREIFGGDRAAYEQELAKKVARLETLQGHERALVRRRAKKELESIQADGFDYDAIRDFIRSVEEDVRHSGKVDKTATNEDALKYIADNVLQPEFDRWVEGLEDRYGIEEMIFNGFTSSGRRRYLPNTLENASKMMTRTGRNGATGSGVLFNKFAARLLKPHRTLEEIRDRKGILASNHEEVEAFRDKWMSVFYDLGEKLQPGATGYEDYGLYRLAEAATQRDPKAYIRKEYGIELSDQDAAQLEEMVTAIRTKYPAMYFETKFERPVFLNEFAGAVIPEETDKEIVDALVAYGVPYRTYISPSQRAQVIREFTRDLDGVRFNRIFTERKITTLERLEHRREALLADRENIANFDKALAAVDAAIEAYGQSDPVADTFAEPESDAHLRAVEDAVYDMQREMNIPTQTAVVRNGEDFINLLREMGASDADLEGLSARHCPEGAQWRERIILRADGMKSKDSVRVTYLHERAHSVTKALFLPEQLYDAAEEMGAAYMNEVLERIDKSYHVDANDVISMIDGANEMISRMIGRLQRRGRLEAYFAAENAPFDPAVEFLDEIGVPDRLKGLILENLQKIKHDKNGTERTNGIPRSGVGNDVGRGRAQRGEGSVAADDGASGTGIGAPIAGNEVERSYFPGEERDPGTEIGRGADQIDNLLHRTGSAAGERTGSDDRAGLGRTQRLDGSTNAPDIRSDKSSMRPDERRDREGTQKAGSDRGGIERGAGPVGDRGRVRDDAGLEGPNFSFEEPESDRKLTKQQQLVADLRRAVRESKASTRAVAQLVSRYVRSHVGRELTEVMGKREFDSLIRQIEAATAKQQVERPLQRIEEIVTDLRIKRAQNRVDKFLQLKVQGEGPRGVSVAKEVDDRTRRMFEIFRDNIGRDADKVKEDLENRGDADSLYDWDALRLLDTYNEALQYRREAGDIDREQEQVRGRNTELRRQRIAANKRGDTDSFERLKEEIVRNNELLDALDAERLQTKEHLAARLEDVGRMLSEQIDVGREMLGEWRQKNQERERRILEMAFRDVGDGKKIPVLDRQLGAWEKGWRWVIDKLFDPAYSLNYLLKMISVNAPNGEGGMYDYFMRSLYGYVESRGRFYLGFEEFKRRVKEKAEELFGKSYLEVLKESNEPIEATISVINGNGKETYAMTNGKAMLVYMLNKMTDTKVKLRRMGITEADVALLGETLPPRFIELADWIQGEFLPERRKVYNETHLDVSGTQMDEHENYFPSKIQKSNIYQKVDGTDPDPDVLPSAITGSIIKRKRNTLPLDLNANALEILLEHGEQMEKWNAFVRIIKDMNMLLSNTTFRRMLNKRNPKLHEKLKIAAQLAVGSYRPKTNEINIGFGALGKLAASSKIAFRINPALKQVLSYPSFYAFSSDPKFWAMLTKNLSPTLWAKNFRWALDNIPSFRERWLGRMAGNEKLAQATVPMLDKMIDKMNKYGMVPNAFVDALTCANGAKAVYDYKKEIYQKRGMGEEEAERRARIDAAVAINETQQSSEGMFISRLQADRDFWSVSVSTFQNSNFAYLRKMLEGIDELFRDAKRERQNRAEYYREQGLSEEEAFDQALKDVMEAKKGAVLNILIFMFLMNMLWTLGNNVWKYLFAEDSRDEIPGELAKSALVATVRNTSVGSMVESFANGYDANPSVLLSDLIGFTHRLQRIVEKEDPDAWDKTAAYLTLQTLTANGLGVDLESFVNLYQGIAGMIRDGADVEDVMQVLNAPKSQAKMIAGKPKEGETVEEYRRRMTFLERRIAARVGKEQLDKWTRNYEAYEKARMLGMKTERDKTGRVTIPELKQLDADYTSALVQAGLTANGRRRKEYVWGTLTPEEQERWRERALYVRELYRLEKELDKTVVFDEAVGLRWKELIDMKRRFVEELNKK